METPKAPETVTINKSTYDEMKQKDITISNQVTEINLWKDRLLQLEKCLKKECGIIIEIGVIPGTYKFRYEQGFQPNFSGK